METKEQEIHKVERFIKQLEEVEEGLNKVHELTFVELANLSLKVIPLSQYWKAELKRLKGLWL